MTTDAAINWIESRGGPLILAPRSALGFWRGVDGSDPEAAMSDYDRICEMTEFIEVFAVGAEDALALGDEPLPTSWIPTDSGGYLVRWVYADSESTVAAFLQTLEFGEFPAPDLHFCTPGDCILFDSADPGYEILGPSLEVSLRPGCYDVSSKHIDVSTGIRLLLHALTWRTGRHD